MATWTQITQIQFKTDLSYLKRCSLIGDTSLPALNGFVLCRARARQLEDLNIFQISECNVPHAIDMISTPAISTSPLIMLTEVSDLKVRVLGSKDSCKLEKIVSKERNWTLDHLPDKLERLSWGNAKRW